MAKQCVVRAAGKLVSENQLVKHFALEETPMRSKHPHGLVVPGDLCTVIDEKGQGTITGSTPMHRSVYDCIDITLHPTREGKLYMCAAWDALSNPVVDSLHSQVPTQNRGLRVA